MQSKDDNLTLYPVPYIAVYSRDWCSQCDTECDIVEMVRDNNKLLYCSTFCRDTAEARRLVYDDLDLTNDKDIDL